MAAPTAGSGPAFSLAGVPIKVEPFFFLVTGFLGWSGSQDIGFTIMWIVMVFASILVHEFGHAFAFMRFGIRPSIAIHGMGGTTFGRGDLRTGQSVFVSLAGPIAGLTLGLITLAARQAGLFPDTPLVNAGVGAMLWVNIGWSFLNLLPILPLDGGHVVESLVVHRWQKRGQQAAYVLSIVTAVAIGIFAWTQGFVFGAILAGFFGFQSVMALQKSNEPGVREQVEAGLDALGRQDHAGAILHLETARKANLTPEGRDLVNRSLASAYQSTGHHDRAHALLAELADDTLPPSPQ